MPEGDGLSRGSPEMAPPSDQYPSSTSSMAPQRAPPATFFCSQQTPHRVQSSTNLDLVDCVGSDLLLAMNNLDVSNEQARSCGGLANGSGNGCHYLLDGSSGGSGGDGSPPPPPPGDGFLPLAALAPPPSRQPAWLTSQQQKARVQNEHFPSRSVFRAGRGGDGEEAAADGHPHHLRGREAGMRMGRLCDSSEAGNTGSSREYDSYPLGSSAGSVNNHSGSGGGGGSPGLPPPGFGLESCSSQGSWSGSNNGSSSHNGVGGIRRPSSSNSNSNSNSGNNSPHLDESWTAVLNAPAGAELMEFLTERASRALVLWNVEAVGEDDLRATCEAYGPLYYLRAEHRRKRVIFVGYYDVRDAVNAHRSLGAELSKYLMNEHGSPPRPAVHFSIELHAGFSYKEGSLFVHNLPSQATEAELVSVFQAYGDLRGVARHSNPTHGGSSFSVEFCSIQDARVAAQELTVRNPWGHSIVVEPAVRSETERQLGRQLHATLNRWTAESTQQVNDELMRSTSSSAVMSGRSSGSDSPPPKPEHDQGGRDVGHMMDLYTPMTSANTTPATTPGSTPPSGGDAYDNGGGKLPGVQHYMTMPLRQYPGSAGPPSSSSSRSMHGQHHHHQQHQQHPHGQGRSTGGSSSAPPHPMYASSGSGGMPHHYGGGSGGSHHHHHHHHAAHRGGGGGNGHHSSHMDNGGSKPHPLASPAGGPNGYYVDYSPGYHPGDRDDTLTPPTPMWAAASLSLSPPSARGGGMRGSPPMHGMPGGCAGGPGGLGYKDRSRQMSLDEGRLLGGGGGCGGARTMRCSSDSASQVVSSSHGGGGGECNGNGGHEFSLDLKKVAKGLDKRTTIMVRNIPNKYTQTMLLQEIDASYRGAYDFFYLPIDFKNKCNVGYAFINFMDYRRIVPFFREFNGQRWKNFNSEKVCAISYARIQGKASMISRFQNSSLMEKDGEYRPLIFHSAGSERGRPEPFPASSKAYRGVGVLPAGGGGMFGGGRDRERSVSNSSSHSMI